MEHWNSDIDKGRNPIASLQPSKGTNFSTDTGFLAPSSKEDKKGDDNAPDNRLFMGNIPLSMTDTDVRKMCEAFGRLKSFNLMKDAAHSEMNKGYAFFEYADDKAVDKAIKGLNNFEIKDKKLRV
jgi:splicing factor U2AF subunit